MLGRRNGTVPTETRKLNRYKKYRVCDRDRSSFMRRNAERPVRRHVRQLEALGFHVTMEKAA
jgi:hypothetical protein